MKSWGNMLDIIADASGPARDLWIEIKSSSVRRWMYSVGSRKGPVD